MNYFEVTVNISPVEPGRDIMIAELAEIGFESFTESANGLEAYIQEKLFNENDLTKVKKYYQDSFVIDYQVKRIEEQNWNAVWEKNFDPIYVSNKCCVRAPFHEKKKNIEFDIIIEPKMSFGTGHHETTFLMIQELMEMNLKDKRVLDMGCGTGVLAILSEFLNAQSVFAVDIDEWSYENTIENIKKNSCNKIEVKLGGAECILGLKFDVVVANINRNILMNDLDKYVSTLNPKGHILLSGFFSSDVELLVNESIKYGLNLCNQQMKNDWTLLHFTNK